MKKPKKIFERNGISYDSDEEIYLSMYLDELKNADYIKKWRREPITYNLCEPLLIPYTTHVQLKTKVRVEQKVQTLLNGSFYTPDFSIEWNNKASYLFYQFIVSGERVETPFIAQKIKGKTTSIIEVKPGFDYMNMTRLFVNNQKFMWAVNNIFINTIVPQDLFSSTFTPQEYLKTNKTGKARKINWLTKTLKEYTDAR